MTPEAPAIAASMHTEEQVSPVATLQTIEQRTRAIAEVAEGLRPLMAFARQAPALVAVLLVIMAAFIFFENLGPLSAVSRGH